MSFEAQLSACDALLALLALAGGAWAVREARRQARSGASVSQALTPLPALFGALALEAYVLCPRRLQIVNVYVPPPPRLRLPRPMPRASAPSTSPSPGTRTAGRS